MEGRMMERGGETERGCNGEGVKRVRGETERGETERE
jgi:hypothetical protein